MELNNLSIIADDLGLAVPVNDGVLFLLKGRKINGVSILPTGAAFNDAVNKLKNIPETQVGIHLTLVEETSVLSPKEIKSLIGTNGRFHANHKIFFLYYLLGRVKLPEIELEFRKQIQRCITSGLNINFLNSHQHLHLLPGIMDIVIKLAVEFKIPYIRILREPLMGRRGGVTRKLQAIFLSFLSYLAIPKLKKAGLAYNRTFVGFLNAGNITKEDLVVAQKYGGELNCHPGYEDELLRRRYSTWGEYNWQKEFDLLKER